MYVLGLRRVHNPVGEIHKGGPLRVIVEVDYKC